MKIPRTVTLLVFLLSPGSPVLAEYKIGDTVVVMHDTTLKVGDKAVQDVWRGMGLKVQSVQRNWLWVSNEAAGWINERDVATPDRAVEIFTEEIKKDQDDSDAYVRRGLAWYDEQEFDLAIADFNEAIRDDPKNASAYSSRAMCWWARREFDRAIGDCSHAIRLNPREPMYLANRGILWNIKGENAKAIADADAALRLNTRFVAAYLVRGKALMHAHDYAGALAEFNAALQVNPRESAVYGLRGQARASQGDYQLASDDFNRAMALDPNDKIACKEIARFYATCPEPRYRDGKKAIEYAQRACEQSGWRWASSISVLAAAYAETGNFDLAIKWQEKAAGMVEGKRHEDYLGRLDLFKAHKPLRQTHQGQAS